MSILSLIYRTTGPWGAGKGANLTPAEVDENFHDLASAIETLTDNPAEANGIDSISQSTDKSQITFHMSDGSTLGPYTLPVATFRNTGAWVPSHAYLANDLFTAIDPGTSDSSVYFVNRAFTSGTTFVPGLGAGIGGVDPYATPLLPVPNKIRVAFFERGTPGDSLPTAESGEFYVAMFGYLSPDAWFIRAADVGSIATLKTEPTGNISMAIYQNDDTLIGSIDFTAGNRVGVVTINADVNFAAGDLLGIEGPISPDATAHGLAVTIVGTAGALDLDSSS